MVTDITTNMTVKELQELCGHSVYFVKEAHNPYRLIVCETMVRWVKITQFDIRIEVTADMGGSYETDLVKYHLNRQDAIDELEARLSEMRSAALRDNDEEGA